MLYLKGLVKDAIDREFYEGPANEFEYNIA